MLSLFFFLTSWLLLLLVFFINSSRLLLSLIVLEILTFFLLFLFSSHYSPIFSTEVLLVALFCVFVMEGVVALSSLIILVSFSGSDYVGSSAPLKF